MPFPLVPQLLTSLQDLELTPPHSSAPARAWPQAEKTKSQAGGASLGWESRADCHPPQPPQAQLRVIRHTVTTDFPKTIPSISEGQTLGATPGPYDRQGPGYPGGQVCGRPASHHRGSWLVSPLLSQFPCLLLNPALLKAESRLPMPPPPRPASTLRRGGPRFP